MGAFPGKFDALIRYLRSDEEIYLSRKSRDFLAWIVENKPWKAKRGRPKDHTVRELAFLANKFYDIWRLMNKRAGISNRGLSNQMKPVMCTSTAAR
jgi:hypothetical protein